MGGDGVVDLVGGVGGRHQIDAEDLGQLALEPEPNRGAAKHRPMRAEMAKRGPRLLWGEGALPHPEVGQADPAGVQQPIHVVVGGEQQ